MIPDYYKGVYKPASRVRRPANLDGLWSQEYSYFFSINKQCGLNAVPNNEPVQDLLRTYTKISTTHVY